MNQLKIVIVSEDLKLMERVLLSYEQRLILTNKKLEHFGLSSEQVW